MSDSSDILKPRGEVTKNYVDRKVKRDKGLTKRLRRMMPTEMEQWEREQAEDRRIQGLTGAQRNAERFGNKKGKK